MERAELDMLERVINRELRERFLAGAVQRAVVLQHGDDPAIEDHRWRRAPDPPVPDQRRRAHRDTVRAFGQPGHRYQLAGHRGGA
jgi:hypothetical protein